uniref:Uncharacterized protein n=1 Tax=Candidatus Kentrum sp. LFY TaxID=2126342 RepID=A0A450V4L2_9GAMM|nr:MAG: hypothetical protein BECKLFY1418A_GA0070994_11055 [Candidatus Kentron sp. LFY]
MSSSVEITVAWGESTGSMGFFKRPENLTEKQGSKLVELLRNNSRTVKSYLLKEEFGFQVGWC